MKQTDSISLSPDFRFVKSFFGSLFEFARMHNGVGRIRKGYLPKDSPDPVLSIGLIRSAGLRLPAGTLSRSLQGLLALDLGRELTKAVASDSYCTPRCLGKIRG